MPSIASGKVSTAGRTRARRYALQALYQWDLSGSALREIEAQFHEDEDFSKVDAGYFHELLHQIPARLDEIDAHYRGFLDRSVDRLDPVERALLRLATYELAERIDIPYRVIINEAVNLGKKFGAEQAHTYINGVLDKAARVLRPLEYPPAKGAAQANGSPSVK